MSQNPILLAHGFLSNKEFLLPLKWRLEEAGFRVYLTPFSFLCIQDIRQLGKELEQRVLQIKEIEESKQIDIIGVSIGGLIGLYYLHQLEGQKHVRRLVTIGTPFQGTNLAKWALPWMGAFSRGLWQVLPGNKFLELITSDAELNQKVSNIGVIGDPIVPIECCALKGARNSMIQMPGGLLKHQMMGFSRRIVQQILSELRQPS